MDCRRLIALLALLVCSNAEAATVVVQQYVSGNDVTLNRLNSNMNAIVNQVNGNLEGGGINIKPGSITSIDLNTTVSTITRWSESFNNFTVSGMLPATSANLASDISAGVSYVSGYRVATAATNHTYTASKDTYVYISNGGYFIYQEVANGGAAPSTPADSLLLASVVTNGTQITSVNDLRQLSIQITATTSNFPSDYRDGALVSLDTTTTMHIEPGQIAIGTTSYSTTTDSSAKSVTSGTNWIEGSAPNIANLKFYAYAYNNSGSQFDLKYSSADPTASDTLGNANGTLRYLTTGGTTYRALAWISGDPSGIVVGSAMGQIKDINNQNTVTLSRRDTVTGTTTMPYDNTPPLITEGDQYFAVPFRVSNINNKIRVEVSANLASESGSLESIALFKNSTLFYATGDGGITGSRNHNYTFVTYTTVPTTDINIFRLRAGSAAGNTTFNGESGTALYGGFMDSRITITEVEG